MNTVKFLAVVSILALLATLTPMGLALAGDGDPWTCPKCGKECTSAVCENCGTAKPEPADKPAETASRKVSGWVFATRAPTAAPVEEPTEEPTAAPTETPAPEEIATTPVPSLDDAYQATFKSKYFRTQKLTRTNWLSSDDNRAYFAAIGVFEVRYYLKENERKDILDIFEDLWAESIALDAISLNGFGNTVVALFRSSDRYALITYDLGNKTVEFEMSEKGRSSYNFSIPAKKVTPINFATKMAVITSALSK